MASCIRYNIMIFNAPLNKISAISWRSVLLVEETGVLKENQPMSRIQVLSMDYYAVLMGTIHFSLLIVFLDI
jgi:hypothetical protein